MGHSTLCYPTLLLHTERLAKLWSRELEHFQRDYNDKLFNGLVIMALADILIFRFVVKLSIMETIGWLLFVFLQVYPKLFLSGGSMYDTRWWKGVARAWELLVYNPVFDLLTVGPVVLVALGVLCVYRCWSRWSCLPQPWWRKERSKEKKRVAAQDGNVKDLDV